MKNKLFIGVLIGIVLIVVGIVGLSSNLGRERDISNTPNTPQVPSIPSNEDIVIKISEKELPIPALLEDKNPDPNISDFYIVAQEGTTSFIDGIQTPTMGYNGSFLGPVVKVKTGDEVNMHITNELSDSTSVHWHGLEVEGSKDGGPHQVIDIGDTWEPSFPIQQGASTLWFHPHVMGTTATQVYWGLAGLIIVEDENSQSLNLPDEYGINDIPLIIQDRSFQQDGSFLYYDNMMNGAFGDHIMVNGAITPFLEVEQRKIRFRILNGANASNFDISLSDSSDFHQIATDGGFLESPVNLQSLFISPGERAEIIIDFSNYTQGDIVELRSYDDLVMTFKIGDTVVDNTVIPDELATIKWFDESEATDTKTIVLDGMGHMVSINGKKFDMHRMDDTVKMGDIQIWEVSSRGSMMIGNGHPFHIHGTQFQVLSRDGREIPPNEKGWKDTFFVGPNESVKIIVQFNHKGVFMYHCHILEHEEAGMMGQLEVL